MLNRINRFLAVLATVALFAVIAITLYDILLATITGRPFGGVYDLVQAFLAAAVFLAMPMVFREESNIQVNLIDGFLSARLRRVNLLVARLATVAFIAILAWSEVKPAYDTWRFEDRLYETGLPVWMIWAPILFGTFLAVFMALSTLWSPPTATASSQGDQV